MFPDLSSFSLRLSPPLLSLSAYTRQHTLALSAPSPPEFLAIPVAPEAATVSCPFPSPRAHLVPPVLLLQSLLPSYFPPLLSPVLHLPFHSLRVQLGAWIFPVLLRQRGRRGSPRETCTACRLPPAKPPSPALLRPQSVNGRFLSLLWPPSNQDSHTHSLTLLWSCVNMCWYGEHIDTSMSITS